MTAQKLLRSLAREFGTTIEQLKSPDRHRSIGIVRALSMLTIREQTELSFPEIARLFGGRHHTTVILNCRSGQFYRETYPGLAKAAERAVERQRTR